MQIRIKQKARYHWVVQVKYNFFLIPYWKTTSMHMTEKDALFAAQCKGVDR